MHEDIYIYIYIACSRWLSFPCGLACSVVGGRWAGPYSPPGPPWCPHGPGPCGRPWALVGQALVGPLGHSWAVPLWAGPFWTLVGSSGLLWARPLWAPLGSCRPGPCGLPWALAGRPLWPPGPLWAGPLWAPGPLWDGTLWASWALMGRALMGSPGPLMERSAKNQGNSPLLTSFRSYR